MEDIPQMNKHLALSESRAKAGTDVASVDSGPAQH